MSESFDTHSAMTGLSLKTAVLRDNNVKADLLFCQLSHGRTVTNTALHPNFV